MFYNNRITHRVVTGYDRFTGSFTVELRDKDGFLTAPKNTSKQRKNGISSRMRLRKILTW